MQIATSQSHRDIISLYFMRFICACMIVAHHTWNYFFGYNISTVTHYQLDIAVDFFFILSGVMMSYIYPSIKNKSVFLLQRIGRLWPVHWVMALVVILFLGSPNLKIIITNLLSLQAFVPYSEYYFSLNSVAWCISIECFFYICYALGHKHVLK